MLEQQVSVASVLMIRMRAQEAMVMPILLISRQSASQLHSYLQNSVQRLTQHLLQAEVKLLEKGRSIVNVRGSAADRIGLAVVGVLLTAVILQLPLTGGDEEYVAPSHIFLTSNSYATDVDFLGLRDLDVGLMRPPSAGGGQSSDVAISPVGPGSPSSGSSVL